jgi:hypothetical protein
LLDTLLGEDVQIGGGSAAGKLEDGGRGVACGEIGEQGREVTVELGCDQAAGNAVEGVGEI